MPATIPSTAETSERVRSGRVVAAARALTNPPTLVRLDGTGRIVMKTPRLTIGRSKTECDVHIDDRSVSSLHCELIFEDDELLVRDLSRHGIQVNGNAVKQCVLQEGDVLCILNHRFRIVLDPEKFIPLPLLRDGEWLVQMAGLMLGPMPWDELQQMARRGALQADDQLLTAYASWVRADEILSVSSVEHETDADDVEIDRISDRLDSGPLLVGEEVDETTPPIGNETLPAPETPTAPDTLPAPDVDAGSEFQPVETAFPAAEAEEAASFSGDPPDREDSSTDDPRNEDPESSASESDSVETDSNEPAWFTAHRTSLQETAVDGGTVPEMQLEPAVSETEKQPDASPDCWYYRRNDIELGPVSLNELREMAGSGLLSPLDAVKSGESEDWVSATSVVDLFPNETLQSDVSFDESALADLDQQMEPPPAVRKVASVPVPVIPIPPVEPAAKPVPQASPRRRFSTPITDLRARLASSGSRSLSFVLQHRRTSAAIVVIASAAAVIACLPRYEGTRVYGRLMLDDEPVANAQITFNSVEQGWGATAVTDESGQYEFSTAEGGLKPGSYVVSIWPESDPEEVQKELQRRYRKESGFDQSAVGLDAGPSDDEAEADDDSDETEAFELPPGTIPLKYRSARTSGLKAIIRGGESNINIILRTDGRDIVLKNDGTS